MNSQTLITYKLRYKTSNEGNDYILKCMKQYSSLLHYGYNRVIDGWSAKQIKDSMKSQLNNVELLDSHIISCVQQEASGIYKTGNNSKLIFGGKKNFIKRCKGQITKEEYQYNRLSPLLSMGEANQKGNRKFRINQDLHTITLQMDKNHHYTLELKGIYGKREKIFSKLYELQQRSEIPITYKIDKDYIYISFNETILSNKKEIKKIENRVFAIDLNPNYVGWSVVDWKSSSEFKVIKSGVISIKQLNDKDFDLKGKGYSSNAKERIYLSNKRTFEIYEISKKLINTALYYQCSIFSMEDLDIKSSDKNTGSKFNKLCNNLWNRNKLELNIQKRCNIFGIKLLKVRPQYSSFVGNFLYRDLNLPDMVLASIEIGRRGYEFYNQYIIKTKEIKKNVITPEIKDFYDRYRKSLEEFNVPGEINDLVDVYSYLKNAGTRYRVSLDDLKTEFSSCFSKTSLILKSI